MTSQIKQSLEKTIIAEVNEYGFITLDYIHKIAEQLGMKQSTAERKARDLVMTGQAIRVPEDIKKDFKGLKKLEFERPKVQVGLPIHLTRAYF